MPLSTNWPDPSNPPREHHIVTDEGDSVVIREYNSHISFSNVQGDTWQLPHVEETADPNVILVAGKPFRRLPG